MHDLIITPPTADQPQTMTSTDLLDIINQVRESQYQPPLRRNDFHDRVADELEGFNYETFVVKNSLGRGPNAVAYHLTQDQALLVSMRESKHVRRSVLKKLRELEAHTQDLHRQLIENQNRQIKLLEAQVQRAPAFDRPDHFCIIEDDTLADVAGVPLPKVDRARKRALAEGAVAHDGDTAVSNKVMGAFSPEGCNIILGYLTDSVSRRIRWENVDAFYDYAVRAAFRRARTYWADEYRKERKAAYWEGLPQPLPWKKAILLDEYPVHDPRLLGKKAATA